MVPADGCITCGAQIPIFTALHTLTPMKQWSNITMPLHKVTKKKVIQNWRHNITLDAEQRNSVESNSSNLSDATRARSNINLTTMNTIKELNLKPTRPCPALKEL